MACGNARDIGEITQVKNQYLTDLGDYGKYGLLRFLAGKGVRIGVNWYLTPDDGSTDGKFKDYRKGQAEDWMIDQELFEKLQEIHSLPEKTVEDVERTGLIPGAVYYRNLLTRGICLLQRGRRIADGGSRRRYRRFRTRN